MSIEKQMSLLKISKESPLRLRNRVIEKQKEIVLPKKQSLACSSVAKSEEKFVVSEIDEYDLCG